MREAIQIIQWASHTLKYLKLRLAGKPGLWTYSHVYLVYLRRSRLIHNTVSKHRWRCKSSTTIYLMAHATIYYRGIRIGSAYGPSFKGSFNYVTQEAPPITLILSIVKTGPLGLTQEGHIFIQ